MSGTHVDRDSSAQVTGEKHRSKDVGARVKVERKANKEDNGDGDRGVQWQAEFSEGVFDHLWLDDMIEGIEREEQADESGDDISEPG